MNFSKHEIEIIKLLISSPNYISSYDIASSTGINRRLVRSEMITIKKALASLGYELISKASKGYMIKGNKSHSLQQLSKLIEDAESHREYVFPILPWERQGYIVRYLIEYNDYIKLDDLAQQLLISRSTISNDLKHAKKDLEKYDLSLKQKPNYGICVTGSEINKRTRVCDFIFSNLKRSEMFYDYLNSYFNDKDSLEYGIIKIIKKNQIEFSDFALCDFLLSLSFSLARIISNHIIKESRDLSLIKYRQEFVVANEIAKFIEKKTNYQIPKSEINQIAIELICKRSISNINSFHFDNTNSLVEEILTEINTQTLLRLHNEVFKKNFALYLETALIRIKYKQKVRNPFYDKLKDTYLLAYTCAEITSSIIYKHTNKYLSRSELAIFAILFHKEIYCKKQPKKKALLICGLGDGASEISKTKILKRFENKIKITKTTQYYQLNDENLSHFDLIISTAPIHQNLAIPHINISQIISNDDLDKINNDFSFLFDQIKLETYFHPQLFKAKLQVKSINEVTNEFDKLLRKVYSSLKISLKNNITLTDRSVSYFSNIAIIKLNKPINNHDIISVLILDNPIKWKKNEIQLFILFSCLDKNHHLYNTIANSTANLIENKKDLNSIFQSPTYQTFLKILKKNQK